jgi:CHASE1-domain containing sensor protein
MFQPVPRVDQWDPLVVAVVLALLALAVAVTSIVAR